ncbi:MAG: hypothetical protein MJ213_00430 [Bacilli bacterium]|nr:hypothetical protein [Bacilli bacterium]
MNKKILTPLFVAASFLLIGCSTSEIVGRPSWIDDKIVTEPTDLKDNTMKEIYDAIKKLGDTNANVLNKVMYDIGKKQVGPLFDEVDKDGNKVLGLKSIVDGTATAEEVKAFVDQHPLYASEDQGYKKGDTEATNFTPEEKLEVSRIKITQQYDSIIERVFEKMYNEVKGGSYTTDSLKKLFSEEEYVRHLKKDFYAPDTTGIAFNGKQVFAPKPIGITWKKFVNSAGNKDGYLHIMDAEDNFTKLYYPTEKDPKYPDDKSKETHGYIGRKILPDIYRELLIEKYVQEQRYTNLGRGYARKAQMIKISPSNSAYYDKVREMLQYYAKLHITGDGSKKATYAPLDDLNSAMIGIADAENTATNYGVVRDYLEAGKFQKINFPGTDTPVKWAMHIDENGEPLTEGTTTIKSTYVFRGTKLGDLVEKYMDAFDLKEASATDGTNFTAVLKYPFTETAKSAYNDLTNSGAYTVDVGLELKERELLSNDLTQDGWYLKEGGLTDLHEDFRSHLFNISTSNIVDDSEYMKTNDKGWGYYESGDYARYFEQDNGTKHAYIVGEAIQSDEPWKTVVLEKDHNFYIVQVDEAASLSKLSDADTRAYIRSKATDNIIDSVVAKSEIVRDITKQVASSDTYKKNAEQYYLMISNILFYDDSVYAYFKSQFPDLFK